MSQSSSLPASIDATLALLQGRGYVADRALATVLFLALRMKRPLLLEGEAGTGKTEIAKTLASALGRKLIRLQCYEGLDLASAVYEWNYAGQMMAIRLAEAGGATGDRDKLEADIFSEKYLVKRPLLQALEPQEGGPPILLIDELDRTDEAFEAFLLEVLADAQVTIPELGTIKAAEPPIVILTSNRTREIHDALKRRCLYHWVGYPDAARELAILKARAPNAPAKLAKQVVAFVQAIREGIPVEQALAPLDIAENTKLFVLSTLKTATEGRAHDIASSLMLAREDLIPIIFDRVLKEMDSRAAPGVRAVKAMRSFDEKLPGSVRKALGGFRPIAQEDRRMKSPSFTSCPVGSVSLPSTTLGNRLMGAYLRSDSFTTLCVYCNLPSCTSLNVGALPPSAATSCSTFLCTSGSRAR